MTLPTPQPSAHIITGATSLCAILGHPIHHVRLPEMFNALMRRWHQDISLVPMHILPDRLKTAVEGLRRIENLAGFAVTVPHKVAALGLCDEASARAHAVGAVNIVRREPDGRFVGDILDGVGFVQGLRQNGVEPRGTRVFLAGAGGAAAAIAFALAEAGIAGLKLWNRTTSKSEELRERLLSFHPSLPVEIASNDPADADLVINATSLGLCDDDPLPLDVERLDARHVVAEIIMKPAMTSLLLAAKTRGCRVCPGAPMLDCQLESMAEFMGIGR